MDRKLASLARRYDKAIFDPDARSIYEGSDFYNVGDWSDGPSGLAEAAARLVKRHLAADSDEEAAAVSVVLDAGCGLGAGAAMMAQRYPNALVLGVNFSPAQAAYAAKASPAARFAVMDAARTALADETVDRVHSVEAAFHFDSRDDFLADVRRILRPGGKAVLTDILYRRHFGRSVPAANIWTGQDEYRSRCQRAGLVVEVLLDITDCTLGGFYDHLEQRGRPSDAAVFRRVLDSYHFAVLHKPRA